MLMLSAWQTCVLCETRTCYSATCSTTPPPSSSVRFAVTMADMSLCRWRTCWSTTCSAPPPLSLRQSASSLAVVTWRSLSGSPCLHGDLRCGSGWLHLHPTPRRQRLHCILQQGSLPTSLTAVRQQQLQYNIELETHLSKRKRISLCLGPYRVICSAAWPVALHLTLPGPYINLTAAQLLKLCCRSIVWSSCSPLQALQQPLAQ